MQIEPDRLLEHACRNQNQILVFIRLAVERWIVVKIECLKHMISRQKKTCDKTYNSTQFVQLCTNKFQGLFSDFLRTNYTLQGLKIDSINWHNPLLNTLLAKTHHRVICDVIPHAFTSATPLRNEFPEFWEFLGIPSYSKTCK